MGGSCRGRVRGVCCGVAKTQNAKIRKRISLKFENEYNPSSFIVEFCVDYHRIS